MTVRAPKNLVIEVKNKKKLKKLENVGETRANAVEKAKTEKRATTTSKCTTESTETRKWVQFGRI